MTEPRLQASRLAAAAGSAGLHWSGGGAPPPGYITRGEWVGRRRGSLLHNAGGRGGGRCSANPGRLSRRQGRRGPQEGGARAARVECSAPFTARGLGGGVGGKEPRAAWSQRHRDRALELPITRGQVPGRGQRAPGWGRALASRASPSRDAGRRRWTSERLFLSFSGSFRASCSSSLLSRPPAREAWRTRAVKQRLGRSNPFFRDGILTTGF